MCCFFFLDLWPAVSELDVGVCFCYRSWSYSIGTRCECVVSITGPGHTVSELDVGVCFCYRSWSYSIRTTCECVVSITGHGQTVSELDVNVLFPLQVLVIQYQS